MTFRSLLDRLLGMEMASGLCAPLIRTRTNWFGRNMPDGLSTLARNILVPVVGS